MTGLIAGLDARCSVAAIYGARVGMKEVLVAVASCRSIAPLRSRHGVLCLCLLVSGFGFRISGLVKCVWRAGRCSREDKFLIAYVLLKLGILTGKVLFFVNNVDRCYELKLFLEQVSSPPPHAAPLDPQPPACCSLACFHLLEPRIPAYMPACGCCSR